MIKECEICINSFPIDCFEFLPCFHKLFLRLSFFNFILFTTKIII